jgi:hypothetical protein
VSKQFLVRIGVLGCLRPLTANSDDDYPHRMQVVCQTQRGLEIGEVLSVVECPSQQPAGKILRALTPHDNSHLSILKVRRDSAFRTCQQELRRSRIVSVLIDVEPLFDGKSLHFYFADEVPPHSEPLRLRLAQTYRMQVVFHSIETESGRFDRSAGKAEDGACAPRGCGGVRDCEMCPAGEFCGKRERISAKLSATAGPRR